MVEEQLLSEEQLLLLENLTNLKEDEPMDSLDGYWEDFKAVGQELTVGRVVDDIKIDELEDDKDYGSYMTGADWKKTLNAIKQDETLMNMKIIAVAGDPDLPKGEKRAEDAPKEGALSAVFVNEESGEAVVAFRGTAEQTGNGTFAVCLYPVGVSVSLRLLENILHGILQLNGMVLS